MSSSINRPIQASLARAPHASNFIFLVVLSLYIVATPFVVALPGGQLINTTLLTLVMVSGLLVMKARRGTLLLAALLVAPAVVTRWINYYRPESMPAPVHLGLGILFLLLVAVQFLRFILRAPRVTAQVLEAGISTYLVFGLVWTMAYLIVGEVTPGAFVFSAPDHHAMNAFDALYYSFVTLTTMGYGDIVPVSRAARMLAVMEATTGVMYMSVLIARLVGMYSTVTPVQNGSDPDRSGPSS